MEVNTLMLFCSYGLKRCSSASGVFSTFVLGRRDEREREHAWMSVTESQNGRNWKGPLWVI